MMRKKSAPSPANLVKAIMGYTSPDPDLPALKYGRLTESEARKSYEAAMVKDGHHSLKVLQSGLHVHPTHSCLGASPDGLVSCSCCGTGILEVKCPFRTADADPKSADLAFLTEHADGTLHLRHNHAYFTQVQVRIVLKNRSR